MANNIFLGLQPYTEGDAHRFKGRAVETNELFRQVVRNNYTVCYAESGEGKTSLINAGLFPLLRENMYFPIAITFTSDDFEITPNSFDSIINRCIKDSVDKYNKKNKGLNVEYKLCTNEFAGMDCQKRLWIELSKHSWWKLRNHKPQAMGLTFAPVFIFDQFEEVFSKPSSIVWTKAFFDWLERVSSDSCPNEIAEKVRTIIGQDAAFPIIKEEKDFKIIFSLRKEYIGELDYWGMQKCFIPELKDNRYCLKALTYEGAKEVVTQQKCFKEKKIEQILNYLVKKDSKEPEKTIAENLPIISALELSIVCDSLEKNIGYFSALDVNQVANALSIFVEKFYDDTIEQIIHYLKKTATDKSSPFYGLRGLNDDSYRKEIEDILFKLIDINDKRQRTKITSIDLSQTHIYTYKKILCDYRIIKVTKIEGEEYIELVHDILCRVIRKKIDTKKRQKQIMAEQIELRRKKRRKKIRNYTVLCVIIAAVIAAVIASCYVYKVKKSNTELRINNTLLKLQQKNTNNTIDMQQNNIPHNNDSIH